MPSQARKPKPTRRPIARSNLLVDEVVNAIRGMIVSGEVAMGERLSENALAERLEVSTTPVREAFALLRREGVVTIKPQSGTYVFELKPGELTQLCELRVALEPVALQLAMGDKDSTLSSDLHTIVRSMEIAHKKAQTSEYLALDRKFHEAIIKSSRNSYLVGAYGLIETKMAALRNRLGTDPHHLAKSMREHTTIAKAVDEGDFSTANRVLISHIARKEGSYWEHLDPSGSILLGAQ